MTTSPFIFLLDSLEERGLILVQEPDRILLTSGPPNWFQAETKIGGKMATPAAWVLHRERKPGGWAGTLPQLSRCP
jgi:hypothetical protein